MKIASVNTRAVRVPREASPAVRGGDTVDFVTLTIRTDDGIEGVGYAGFQLPVLTPALKAIVDALGETIIGHDPVDTEAVADRLFRLGGGSPAGLLTRAISAIDVALWDIKGKALGQPVYRLLGGFRDRVPAYQSGYLWRPSTLEELDADARRIVSEGFRSMKFRLGAGAVRLPVSLVRSWLAGRGREAHAGVQRRPGLLRVRYGTSLRAPRLSRYPLQSRV